MSQEWVRLPVGLLKSKELSPVECVVLAVLIDRCEQETDISLQELADCCNISLRTAKTTIATLTEKGLISKQPVPGYASKYVAAGVLPPKRRSSKQAVLDAELKDLRKQAEVQKLKKQLQDDDVSKYEAVINKF